MVTDARRFDAIVVGSGAAGGWAAKQLAESGLSVLMLEAGRAVDPQKDFPVAAGRADSPLAAGFEGPRRGQPIQSKCGAYSALTREFYVSDAKNPYTAPSEHPFLWFRGRQVGGRLHTWGRTAV